MKRDCTITIDSVAPYVIGTTISASVDVQPYSAGLRYVWFNESGILYDAYDLTTINLVVSNTKFDRLLGVSVIDGSESVIASIKYTAQHAEVIPQIPTAMSGIKRKQDNLELYRWLSYAPKWSFANKSFLSNYSKLTSGIYNYVKNIEAKPIYCAAYNYVNSQDTFDFNPYIFKKPIVKVPKEVITNMGVFEYIGQNNVQSINSYPITNMYLEEVKPLVFEYEYDTDQEFSRFKLSKNVSLYITLTDNIEADVTIVGLDADGKLIKDSIHILPRISHKTVMKYSAVIGIYSSVSLVISTMSKSDSYVSGYIDYKRITDMSGDYFEPFFSVDIEDPNVLCVKKLDERDVYKFRLEREIDKFVVTENLDILYISNNILYSAKPYFDVAANLNINSTYNNNDICSVAYDDVTDGDNINFIINTSAISGITKLFTVKIENGASTQYLSGNQLLVADKTSISTNGIRSKVQFSIQKLNKDPYIVSIQCEGIREVFQCGVIDNNITSYHLSDNIYDLNIYDGNVIISSSATSQNLIDSYTSGKPIVVDANMEYLETGSSVSIFKIHPIRGCYSSDVSHIIFNTKVDIEEELNE